MPHKRDVFNVCGAWAFYQLSKTGSYTTMFEKGRVATAKNSLKNRSKICTEFGLAFSQIPDKPQSVWMEQISCHREFTFTRKFDTPKSHKALRALFF